VLSPSIAAAHIHSFAAAHIHSFAAAHRVSPLLSSVFGIDIPPDSPRLFASLLPPDDAKADALQ
jgi:hypothetical protein